VTGELGVRDLHRLLGDLKTGAVDSGVGPDVSMPAMVFRVVVNVTWQWVLSLPRRVRFLLTRDSELEEVGVLYRDKEGYIRAELAARITGIQEFVARVPRLGTSGSRGRFGVGDPLLQSGEPTGVGKR
jgi:hypothetical protein